MAQRLEVFFAWVASYDVVTIPDTVAQTGFNAFAERQQAEFGR
jgi:hypothetical protein